MPTEELINQRRRQVLVHSVIYYRFGASIISDQQWDAWARELARLQSEHPDLAARGWRPEVFKDFDPCSGYYLPLSDPWAVEKAAWLLDRKRIYDLQAS